VTIVAFLDPLTNTNSSYAGYNAREILPVVNLNSSFTGWCYAIVTIKSQTTHAGTLDGAYLGHSGGGTNGINFDGGQVPLKWGGSTSLSWSGAATKVSDQSPAFFYNPTKALVWDSHWTGTSTAASATTSLGATTNNYSNVGGSQVGVTVPANQPWLTDGFSSWVFEIDLIVASPPFVNVWG